MFLHWENPCSFLPAHLPPLIKQMSCRPNTFLSSISAWSLLEILSTMGMKRANDASFWANILIQNQPPQSEINNPLSLPIPLSKRKRMMHAPALGRLFYKKQMCWSNETLFISRLEQATGSWVISVFSFCWIKYQRNCGDTKFR